MHNMAITLIKTGQIEEAKNILIRSLKINPDYSPSKSVLKSLQKDFNNLFP